jgi:hypothetical protein
MEVIGQLHAPAALSREKCPRYLLDRRMDEPQGRSGRGCEEKITTSLSRRGNGF